MANLDNVPSYYLRIISDLFALNEPETVRDIINSEIEKREKPRYEELTLKDMCEWGILTIREAEFLYNHNINNFKELLECNLDDLVGISSSLKATLDQKRKFYDISKYMCLAEEEFEIIDGPHKK